MYNKYRTLSLYFIYEVCFVVDTGLKQFYQQEESRKRITNILSNTIKRAIINLYFKSAERIAEDRIAAALDVSVSSVREALKILCYEDFVIFNKGSGYYVAHISRRNMLELNEMLRILTYACAESFNINDACAIVMIKESLKCDVETDHLQLDKKFHMTLALCCDNSEYIDTMRDVYDKLEWGMRALEISDVPDSILQDHHLIADAILGQSQVGRERIKELIDDHAAHHQNIL